MLAGTLGVLVTAALAGAAQDTSYPPLGEGVPGPELCGEAGFLPLGGQIPGPRTPAAAERWLEDLRHFRSERLIRAGYAGEESSDYSRPELSWTQSAFVEHLLMIHDRSFYDPVARRYEVDRLLDDLEARFGGIDVVLLWHSYPNLGIDDRNQYDLIRDMPGGVAGVRSAVEAFHRRGVRVLFPINLWDQGTRAEGVSDPTAIARLMADINADGLNGDTLAGFPPAFRRESDAAGRTLALEPTDSPPAMALSWNTMSWGLCWKYSFAPLLSTFKWLEPRHMVHVAPRWGRDKTNDLQFAFFNGVGIVSWENIWGIWNELTARDRAALRRTAAVLRSFPELLTSRDWQPFWPTEQSGVFATAFPGESGTLWTIVNRNEHDVSGPQLRLSHTEGARYFDLWNGVELSPEREETWAMLELRIEARGFGAILKTTGALEDRAAKLLARAREWSQTPLRAESTDWAPARQAMKEIAPAVRATDPPASMVRIEGGPYLFAVSGIEIEGGDLAGVDVQFPWEDAPRRHHRQKIDVAPFFIDRHPVTNREFQAFLEGSGYRPEDDHNFLKHWRDGTYPAGWDEKPVTWVSLEDARAYAAWAGKRLPHEWEWQYAAQGTDGRRYPWGNEWNETAVPPPDTGRSMGPPPDVGAFPEGASPFGVEDLVGTIWQWTDEYADDHTRAAILRGGSFYRPQGSRWYFPQAYALDEHGKYLLMAPSLDRSGTIGFRLVKDAER
jgi:formylglycine-generating enzyme required for sulfatase activity